MARWRRKMDEFEQLMQLRDQLGDEVEEELNHTHSWGEQLHEAFAYEGQSTVEQLLYLLSLPWKARATSDVLRVTGYRSCKLRVAPSLGVAARLGF